MFPRWIPGHRRNVVKRQHARGLPAFDALDSKPRKLRQRQIGDLSARALGGHGTGGLQQVALAGTAWA